MTDSLEETLAGSEDVDGIAATIASDCDGSSRSRRGAELARGALVGRYIVLAKIGAGSMGVVYAAHDPQLDRKVALKLLHPDEGTSVSSHTDGRARLLREAQALAMLGHPGVVAIHDVGEHAGSVYLAMEFVEGTTLRDWLRTKRRSWREVLAVMRSAALGLIAAHEKGLLHRDIKPDNIMVGHEGRVRVMDFGLARSGRSVALPGESETSPTELARLDLEVTRVGALLGTPAYMASEQWRGGEVGPAADQFGFCVTLWEALFSERPFAGASVMELAAGVLEGKLRPAPRDAKVPTWLRRACARGLEVDPTRRWPSMQALVVELDRAQSRVRTRRLLVGLGIVALIVAGAEGHRRHQLANRVAACDTAGAEIDEVWNEAAQVAVRGAFRATEVGDADVTVDKLAPWLDAHAEAWRAGRTEACVAATIERRFDDETYAKALWCFEDHRLGLAALIDEFEHADPLTVHRAVAMATALTSPADCSRPDRLATMPALPADDARLEAGEIRADLARARAMKSRGRNAEGLELARAALARSEALGYSPLSAAAKSLEGALLEDMAEFAEAERSLRSAYIEAAKASAWDIAVEAAIELEFVVGDRMVRPDEGKAWADHAEVALAHAGDPLGLSESMRLTNLALVVRASGDDDEARRLHERALELRERALGPEHLAVATSLTNIANILASKGDYPAAKLHYERALDIRERALGSVHPEVANAINNLAGVYYYEGDYEEAESLYTRALAIQERALGPDHVHLAITVVNLANIQSARGEYEQAKLGLERALTIHEKALGVDHPSVAAILNNLGRIHERNRDPSRARATLERALGIRERTLGPEHPDVATTLTNLALVEIAEGEYDGAQALLERALAIREKVGPEHPNLGYTLDGLARVALDQQRPADAIVHAERAVRVREAAKVASELVAASRFLLARALADASAERGGDLVRALALALSARDAYREAEGVESELREVEDWLARHEG